MAVQFYMNEDVRLRRNVLPLPTKRGVTEGRHVSYLDKTTPHHKFLLIVPGQIADTDPDLWALSFLGFIPRLGELEAKLGGAKVRIKIPTAYLSDVSLRPNSLVRVIRYVTDPSRDYSEIWKPSDFREYENLVSWQNMYKAAMRFGL